MNSYNSTICPICLNGRLEQIVEKHLITIDIGSVELDNVEIPTHFSICDTCGCTQADAIQTNKNKNIMLELKHKLLQEQADKILNKK